MSRLSQLVLRNLLFHIPFTRSLNTDRLNASVLVKEMLIGHLCLPCFTRRLLHFLFSSCVLLIDYHQFAIGIEGI